MNPIWASFAYFGQYYCVSDALLLQAVRNRLNVTSGIDIIMKEEKMSFPTMYKLIKNDEKF